MTAISLAPSAESVALAALIADILDGNMVEKPRKEKDFNALDTIVYIKAHDADVDLTMKFDKGNLTIFGGKEDKPDIAIFTDIPSLIELTNITIKLGLPNVFNETGRQVLKGLIKRDLRIKGMILHAPSFIRLSRVISVM